MVWWATLVTRAATIVEKVQLFSISGVVFKLHRTDLISALLIVSLFVVSGPQPLVCGVTGVPQFVLFTL